MITPPRHILRMREYPSALQSVWNERDKDKVLKLDWNESSDDIYGEIVSSHLCRIKPILNWYPPIADEELLSLLVGYVGLEKDFISYFSGSDRALEYLVRSYCEKGDIVTIFSPTYDNFRIYAESLGCSISNVYNKNYFLPDESILERINPKSQLIYIVNPNNPTGCLYNIDFIKKVLRRFPNALVIVDEAYIEFCHSSSSSMLVKEFPNLATTRTFSKAMGLASIRFGYLLSHKEINKTVRKITNHKDVQWITLEVAKIALKNLDIMRKYVEDVNRSKEFIAKHYRDLEIFQDIKISPANFMLVQVHSNLQDKLLRYLRGKKVFIRSMNHLKGLSEYNRITIGSLRVTKQLHTVLKRFRI